MKSTKSEKMREAIRHAAAEFMAETADQTSLITVTNVHLAPKGDKATILITVFPDEKEKDALAFAARQGGKLRDFIGQRISLQHLPYISFALDVGEKNRQKIEELSSQSK
ncbi:MAG: ribosome-binding factor A [Candidatus Taylorbacteria bacterium]|nr:ribosome-binding factor A [Candidatus Taylorbacteria bacterium]